MHVHAVAPSQTTQRPPQARPSQHPWWPVRRRCCGQLGRTCLTETSGGRLVCVNDSSVFGARGPPGRLLPVALPAAYYRPHCSPNATQAGAAWHCHKTGGPGAFCSRGRRAEHCGGGEGGAGHSCLLAPAHLPRSSAAIPSSAPRCAAALLQRSWHLASCPASVRRRQGISSGCLRSAPAARCK